MTKSVSDALIGKLSYESYDIYAYDAIIWADLLLIALYIHGGGFCTGDKTDIPQNQIEILLELLNSASSQFPSIIDYVLPSLCAVGLLQTVRTVMHGVSLACRSC
jgi:hypothetical protein